MRYSCLLMVTTLEIMYNIILLVMLFKLHIFLLLLPLMMMIVSREGMEGRMSQSNGKVAL